LLSFGSIVFLVIVWAQEQNPAAKTAPNKAAKASVARTHCGWTEALPATHHNMDAIKLLRQYEAVPASPHAMPHNSKPTIPCVASGT